jgi:hypothetical protein
MKTKLNTAWSASDVRTMRKLARKKVSARIAAQKLGRSRGAVAFKAMRLGIAFRAIRQPKGVQKRIHGVAA